MPSKPDYAKPRQHEQIGGGIFVFRRHSTSGRIHLNPSRRPFEHPTRQAAIAEAQRLADLNPGKTFCIFEQVAEVKADGAS